MRAEIERVWTGTDELTLELRLRESAAAPPREVAVLARRVGDAAEVAGRVELDGAGAPTAWMPLVPLEPLGDETEVWELWLRTGGPDGQVRLTARAGDDVPAKATSYVFAPRIVQTGPERRRRYRPVYDAASALTIRSTRVRAAGEAPAARGKRPAGRRSRLQRRMLLIAHRSALAALGAALRLRRRPAAGAERPRLTLLLAHAYGIGGTTRTVLNLAGSLSDRYEVEVLSVLRRQPEPLLTQPVGVKVTAADDQVDGAATNALQRLLRRLPSVLLLPADHRMRRWTSLMTDVRLVRALWRMHGDVVVGTRPSLNALATALRAPGTVAIAAEHMNLKAHGRQMRAELLRCYPRLDATVLLTEHDRDGYRQVLGEGPKLVAIPNAVPLLPGPRSSLDRPVVVAVGRLSPQKGFDRLIPAFAQVVERQPEWTLRICGGGRVRRDLERLIAEHDMANHITLLGSISDVETHLAAASMFVLSSRFEGLPMALIEAMSKGLPVVSFDCPTGPAEVIEHGRTGLLVPNGDIDALAGAILELIEDEPRRRSFGAAAAVRAEAFSREAVAARWDTLISELR